MDIGAGDWVVAVASCENGPGVVAGATYYVRGIWHSPQGKWECTCCGHKTDVAIALDLGREPNDWWHHCLFKPLKKPPEEAPAPAVKVCEPC
jgi:hypothetical protein